MQDQWIVRRTPLRLIDARTGIRIEPVRAEPVAALAKANPLIARTEILPDYAGIDRVVVAWRTKECQ